MRRPRKPAQSLRTAVECMPYKTRVAMLEGIGRNEIIVGAYTDNEGGICPMLAAHRNGGRTNFATFARAWDRYTGASNRARRASEREVRTLVAMLESSVSEDPDIQTTLGEAVADHRQMRERRLEQTPKLVPPEPAEGESGRGFRLRRRRETGERNRAPELRRSQGWAWLRPFRRYEDYAAALERLEHEAEHLRDPEQV
jgi:hypothetical protein